jgi:superfamily II RNA helicase
MPAVFKSDCIRGRPKPARPYFPRAGVLKLDPFQQQAIDYINQGHSVLVAAPTGAGKTLIAEHVIQTCLQRGQRVIYTAPIKALSNQKYRDFQDESGNHAGILTGDIVLNPHAQLLIMTTEIFRNKILEEPGSLEEYSWIIFDEIHYLDDYERGCVWEESLMFMPGHMRLLGLSATVPNIDEIGRWLSGIHGRKVRIVKEDRRPVPLHFYFQCQNEVYDDMNQLVNSGFVSKAHGIYRPQKIPKHVPVKANRSNSLIRRLQEEDRLPCIYFVFSRRRTEELAREMLVFNFVTDDERRRLTGHFDELCAKFDITGEDSVEELRPLIERGIAYHHAGMLPTLKEAVERLFTSRLLKVIFTTETFALGINMPARSVIFDELRKFYGFAFQSLKTRDFYQMAGRAGRRSIDTEGHVYCRVNPHFISPGEIDRIINGEPEQVNSQFNASYATVLNLYQEHKDKLYDIYPYSLHCFQVKKIHRQRALAQLKGKVDILKELGYIKGGELTPKGLFASKVYGYELILSELYEEGVLERLSVKQLGVLIMAVVFEARKGVTKPPLKKDIAAIEDETRNIVRRVHSLEKTVRVRDLTKRCQFHLTGMMEAWIDQKDFRVAMQLTDVDEGEVVRYMRMCIQLLKEIAGDHVPASLGSRLRKVVDLINRDVVDSEKQLRS